ncbi:helix-turn-helix domain-containing protein [Streptosporangium amethystogenes]|uniref:helix-turn-helix domain-containing protein n=1 Tax=Streptosporangium amethystogenes TaxID=2002 RepID=UPI0004C5D616|nr:helix-turn-helix domain-containing protein [Streptosporangium amethystogenes]
MAITYSEAARRNLAKPSEVAEFLGVPEKTLTEWRYLRKGPPYGKVGRYIRYSWRDVESWFAEQVRGGAA